MASVVIVVDTQADFMLEHGALAVPGAAALIAPMAAWLGRLDPRETAAVLFTFDTHQAGGYAGSAEAEAFPLHCVAGTPGWENMLDAASIDPAIPVHALDKGVFAMWQEDDLMVRAMRDRAAPSRHREDFFAGLRAAGVKQAIVIGVAADYCVRWAIDGLVERGFAVSVPAGLTRGIARQIDRVVAEDFAGRPVTIGG